MSGVAYYRNDTLGDLLSGDVTFTEDTTVVAAATAGYVFPDGAASDWTYTVG